MKELRDIKIDLLTGNRNPIVDLFNQITDGIKIINCDVYNKDGLEFIYYNNGDWIFYQDSKNENFWCNYSRYWSFFESNLNLEYKEIQVITKFLVEEALKREVTPPRLYLQPEWSKVEEALKREVTPPKVNSIFKDTMVEEALKLEVTPPYSTKKYPFIQIEEALKREVAPPLH